MKYYSGIGSRTTPPHVLSEMEFIASQLELRGYTLRSGGAIGADAAFQKGVSDHLKVEIYRPSDSTREAEALAEQIHPAWHACNVPARRLHGRNVQIVLGRSLDLPSEFVVCWTPEPVTGGGTRTGIVIAEQRKIPVFNLFNEACRIEIQKLIDGLPLAE